MEHQHGRRGRVDARAAHGCGTAAAAAAAAAAPSMECGVQKEAAV